MQREETRRKANHPEENSLIGGRGGVGERLQNPVIEGDIGD